MKCMVYMSLADASYKVKAPKATHKALDVVSHSEEALLPARLSLDLGLDS